MDRQELQRLARLGAAARLAELDRERAMLLRQFPGLRASAAGSSGASAADGQSGQRKRRGMSAAGRRAVSVRMKKYWAARRKEKAKE
jgi:hypothetical protein